MSRVPNASARKAVPWDMKESGGFQQWVWEARHSPSPDGHFTAEINSEGGKFEWSVTSDAIGNPVRLNSGRGVDFEQCQLGILMTVGKAFATSEAHLGLADQAKHYYVISSGQLTDFSPMHKKRMQVTLAGGRTLAGVLHSGGWEVVLENPQGDRLFINPAAVLAVEYVS